MSEHIIYTGEGNHSIIWEPGVKIPLKKAGPQSYHNIHPPTLSVTPTPKKTKTAPLAHPQWIEHRREIIRRSRRKSHQKLQATSLNYRLKALLRTLNYRCTNPKHIAYRWYGGKRIRNFLSLDDLMYLWHRDRAWEMERPSLDRIKSRGHYTLDNCRFLPQSANTKRSWRNKAKRIANGHGKRTHQPIQGVLL